MRISTTALESFRLWRQPDQEWMTEQALIDSLSGTFVPTHQVSLGSAFGLVLEDPDRYLVPGGFRIRVNGEGFEFGRDVMEPCLAVIPADGVFEAKGQKAYGACDVVAKADHLAGAHLREFKTTLSTFDVTKYLDSYQWRFMADIFQPAQIIYHVFCLAEATNGVISLRSIESFNLFPYAALHADCCGLLDEFVGYVTARGLDRMLRARQAAA